MNYVMKTHSEKRQLSRQDKRIRMRRELLEDKLFQYFEKKKMWNLRALRDQLDQPEVSGFPHIGLLERSAGGNRSVPSQRSR